MDNVPVAIVADDDAATRAAERLRGKGFTDETLRLYTSEQILAYDAAFRAGPSLKERVVGAIVDDAGSMNDYVAYAGDGHAALWVLVDGRDDANRVIRLLVDHDLKHVWFHGLRRVETIRKP